MTHSKRMRVPIGLVVLTMAALIASGQSTEEDFSVYKEHPRLLLTPQRLKLLRREKDRSSARWQQFDTLMRGKAQMPEPAFADALYFQVSGDQEAGRRAVRWALGSSTDLRQLAIVYDWCDALLSPADREALRKKISAALRLDPQNAPMPAARSYAFAVIAVADDLPDTAKRIGDLVNTWWRGKIAADLKNGAQAPLDAELYPLYELLHAIRDNTGVDLRQDAPYYFKDLPAAELLSYYPAVYPAPENEFRIPAFTGKGEPDLKVATMSRVAELAMVAYDTNATDSQFIQGWVLHDRFILHSALGAPYEFLWANPYQPGLSFYHLPLSIHDARHGRMFIRSSWDDDATWLGYINGELQVFQDGKIRQVSVQSQSKMITIGSSGVLTGKPEMRIPLTEDGPSSVYIVGLKPSHVYSIEPDDEEMDEVSTDRWGNLGLSFTRKDARTVRIAER